ncbi:MAG: hypothetical protein JXA25_11655 [Anaerolineales bacterium]|nr:hypothetical protein [Anaerolineales bacterium]
MEDQERITQQNELPARALVVGDPERVLQAVGRLKSPVEVWRVREFLAWRGYFHGESVLIASHGVGPSSASLVLEQLFQRGVQIVLRAGTCGALQSEVTQGTLVIPTGAIRDDRISEQVLPLEVPAIADVDLVHGLQAEAARAGYLQVSTGLVWSSGVFYDSPQVPARAPTWIASGAIAVEMEMALLLILARRYSARAAGMLAVEGGADQELDPWNRPVDSETNQKMIQSMLDITLETLVSVA